MNPLGNYCNRCGSNLMVARHADNCPWRPRPDERDARIAELKAALHGLIGFVIDHMQTGADLDSRYQAAIRAMRNTTPRKPE